jgi:hypothetical protein
MAALLNKGDEVNREAAIKMIAKETASFSDPVMLEGGGFSFRQEACVGTGHATS